METFDKIQRPFMIKTHRKVGMEVSFYNMIKSIYEIAVANIIILEGEKWSEYFLPEIRKKARTPTVTTLIQYNAGSSNKYKARKINK